MHEILRVLLLPEYHTVLLPVVSLETRCREISDLMLLYRANKSTRLTAFYLAQLLDSFIPAYRVGVGAPSQLTMQDHVSHNGVVTHTPHTAAACVVARAIRRQHDQKYSISHKPTDAKCNDFSEECVRVSMLGNYLHANFADPTMALTIADRVHIIDVGFIANMVAPYVDIALAEYGVTFIQDYPQMTTDGVPWVDCVTNIKNNADTCIRGTSTIQNAPYRHFKICSIVPSIKNPKPRIVACAMKTGALTTYICSTCNALSAFVHNRQRGLKHLLIMVDPLDETENRRNVKCINCSVLATSTDLSGRMIIYSSGYILVVCPVCNFLAAHRNLLRTTVCMKCTDRIETIKTIENRNKTCYIKGHTIVGEIFQQVTIINGGLILLPSCSFHHSALAYLMPPLCRTIVPLVENTLVSDVLVATQV